MDYLISRCASLNLRSVAVPALALLSVLFAFLYFQPFSSKSSINDQGIDSTQKQASVKQPIPSEELTSQPLGIDDTSTANLPASKDVTNTVDVDASIEEQNLARPKMLETVDKLEREVRELDQAASEGIQLLFEKTGTSEEDFKKRYAELLKQKK